MKWRIWDYDENTKTIRLISEKPTDATLSLKGATGYNNGVWAINEICRQCYGQYNSDGKMKEGINVANLRRSDIEKVTKYDYTKYNHNADESNENGTGIYIYGEKMKNNNDYGVNYPKIWETNDKKWTYENNDGKVTGDKEGLIWEEENGYETENRNRSWK